MPRCVRAPVCAFVCLRLCILTHELVFLSSPRAESARAVILYSRNGEGFLTGQPDFFTETAVTPERKVEKSFPRWEINRHDKG